jgi:hypothetical protein
MKVVDKTKNKHQQKKEAAASKNNKKEDVVNNQEGCCIPMIECLKPGDPLPQSLADGIKFECSNHDCLFAKQFAHVDCFKELEDQMLILLRSHGGARGWPEEKLQMAFKKVWGRKGSIFLQGALKCKCGKGLMMKDESAWVYKEPKALVEPEPEKKERKKAKTKVLPELQHKNVSHKLDHHYLSSRSPPPDASTFEEKYGPITKAPKRTRKETDNSMTSTNDTNVVKKRVPIGFAPIDPKPAVQKQKSEEPQPKHHRPVETKPPEPVKAWQKVDHHIVPDPIEHTVESETVISERVESEAMNLQEKLKAEEIAKRKGNPWEHAEELRESFKISATTTSSKFVTTAVQTEETCFPNHCYKHYQNRSVMSVQTENEVPSPGSVLNGFDSGINSTSCSPKPYANSYQQKPSFGDSNAFVPPGYPGDRLKKLSISDNPEMQKMNYGAASQPTIPVFSAPTINFLFKDNHFALEVCQNGRREYIKNALGIIFSFLSYLYSNLLLQIMNGPQCFYQC